MYGNVSPIGALALTLSAATLLVGLIRMGVTFSDVRRLSSRRERDSITDALTGLGNRRRLLSDLGELLDGPANNGNGQVRPHLLTLFDLDGFKSYNDAFGHPAGDELLARLGRNLDGAVAPWGRAYRLGGDEFCAVFAPGDLDPGAVVAAAVAALTEQGRASR